MPYVIVCGTPGMPLYELVRTPYELIDTAISGGCGGGNSSSSGGGGDNLKLNYEYYVMKQIIPPLQRIMCLLGVNVYDWIKPISLKPKVNSNITFDFVSN